MAPATTWKEKIDDDEAQRFERHAQTLRELQRKTAAGRPATGRDLANAVAFLLSDEAETISGTVVDVGCFAHQGGPVPPRP